MAGEKHRYSSDQCVNENNYQQSSLLIIRGVRICSTLACSKVKLEVTLCCSNLWCVTAPIPATYGGRNSSSF